MAAVFRRRSGVRAALAGAVALAALAVGASGAQAGLYRVLHALGVAPPYWRYLPELLSFPPLHFLRSRNPSVKAPG